MVWPTEYSKLLRPPSLPLPQSPSLYEKLTSLFTSNPTVFDWREKLFIFFLQISSPHSSTMSCKYDRISASFSFLPKTHNENFIRRGATKIAPDFVFHCVFLAGFQLNTRCHDWENFPNKNGWEMILIRLMVFLFDD